MELDNIHQIINQFNDSYKIEINEKIRLRKLKQTKQLKDKNIILKINNEKEEESRKKYDNLFQILQSLTPKITDIIQNYNQIVSFTDYNNEDTVLNVKDNNKWVLDQELITFYDNICDCMTFISDISLIFLKALKPVETNIVDFAIPRYMTDIKRFNYKDLNFSKYTGTFVNPKLRYIATTSAKQVSEILNNDSLKLRVKKYAEDANRLSDVATEKDLCEYGYSKMCVELSSQTRFSDVPTQIGSMLFIKQRRSYAENHCNTFKSFAINDKIYKRGIDLVGIQFIKSILSNHDLYPFIEVNDRLYFRTTSKDTVMSLNMIIYAALQIATLEFTNVYSFYEAQLAVRYLIKCSEYSISQGYLDHRSKLRELEMWTMKNIKRLETLTRDVNGKILSRNTFINFDDFSLVSQDKIRDDNFNKMDHIDKEIYFHIEKYINTIRSGENDTDAIVILRYIRIILYCITCPSIYNKTSLKLEYEKSASPKIIEGLKYPPIKEYITLSDSSLIPISWYWEDSNPVFSDIYNEFELKYKNEIIAYLKTLDFEARFADVMTNRSEGVKTLSDDLPDFLQKISNTRTISLALTPEDMNIYDRFLEKLRSGGKCTIRYQIDRRARVVVMVIKQKQSQQIINLEGFNHLKTLTQTVDVGRQKGDIRNCAFQLYASSGTNGVCDSSDMKGQDAHTLPITTDFINDLYMQTVRQNEKLRYFFSNTNVEKVFDKRFNYLRQENLSGIFKLGVLVMRNDKPTQYILDDKYFNFKTDQPFIVSDFTYPSGLYGTTGQHTTLLTLAIESGTRVWNETHPPDEHIITHGRVVGDDTFKLLIGRDDVIENYIKFENKRMNTINFEMESTHSKIFATFLQNDCLGGIYVPKPHRMSIFVEEKSEVHRREKIDIIENIVSTSRILAQRTFSPTNMMVITFSIWNLLRKWRYDSYNIGPSDVNEILNLYPFITTDTKSLIVKLPIHSLIFKPFYGIIPNLNVSNKVIQMGESTSASGDGQLLNLLRQLVYQRPIDIYEALKLRRKVNNLQIIINEDTCVNNIISEKTQFLIRKEKPICLRSLICKSDNLFLSRCDGIYITTAPILQSPIMGSQYYKPRLKITMLDLIYIIMRSMFYIKTFADKTVINCIVINNEWLLMTKHEFDALKLVESSIIINNDYFNHEIKVKVVEVITVDELVMLKISNGCFIFGIGDYMFNENNINKRLGYIIQMLADDFLITKTSLDNGLSDHGYYGMCGSVYITQNGYGEWGIYGFHFAGSKYLTTFGIYQNISTVLLNRKTELNMVSEFEELKTLDMQDIYYEKDLSKLSKGVLEILTRPSEDINLEAIKTLNINEIYYFLQFNRVERFNQLRYDQVDYFHIDKLVNFYKQYQIYEKTVKSRNAYDWFLKHYVRPSKSLAYFYRPRKKIEDALVAREQTLTERKLIDQDLLKYLLKFRQLRNHNGLLKKLSQQLDHFFFQLYIPKEPENLISIESVISKNIKTMPAYNDWENFGWLFNRNGTVSNSTYLSASEYKSLLNDFDIHGGLENVLKELRRTIRSFPNKDIAIDYFSDMIDIPRNKRNAFRSLAIEEIRSYYETDYTSFCENQSFFDVNTNPNINRNNIDIYSSSKLQTINEWNKIITDFGTQIRDLILLKPNSLTKYNLYIHPFTYVRYILSRRISNSELRFVMRVLT